MDNQHRKITGYRELAQVEIDLMNRIKAHAEEGRVLHSQIAEHLRIQVTATQPERTDSLENPFEGKDATPEQAAEWKRICSAEPHRWLAIAKTDLQTGYMAMTRAVAQPSTF